MAKTGGSGSLWDSFAEWFKDEPEWVREDAGSKAVLVCEYFYKEHESEKVTVTDHRGEEHSRDRDVVTVYCSKITGYEVLETKKTNGQYIPLIPVLGRELIPIDGKRWWIGMVRNARDAQRFFNAACTSLLERMFMEPKAPWMVAEGQDEGFEREYLESNVRNIPVIHYKATSVDGKLVGPPNRVQLDQTGMSIALQAVQVSDTWIQANTSVYDESLGRGKKEESGRKVLALQGQSDASTSDYSAGLADMSIPYEARIVLDWMPAVYDRPGRVTQILGDEDKTKTVMLNAPYVPGPGGEPQRVQDGQPGAKMYNLADRGYTTSVSIGKNFQTRLQQGQEAWSELIPNLPPEAQVILLPTLMRFLDSPGSTEAADMMAKYRDKTFPFLADNEEGAPTVEQLQAQLEAAKAQGQEMQQQLQQAAQAIETDQAKQQATLQKTQMDNQTKVQLAQIEQQAKQAEQAREDALKLTLQRMDEAFKEWLAKFEAAHEVAMAAAGGNTMTRTRENGQEQEGERSEDRTSGSSSASAPETTE